MRNRVRYILDEIEGFNVEHPNARHDSGYFALAGAVIKQAVTDYIHFGRTSQATSGRDNRYNQAKRFLFTNELEDFLRNLELDDIVSAKRIRLCLK